MLCTSWTNGKREAQLLWSIAVCMASMLCMVECTRSDTEFPWGRYGVVRVFLYPSVFLHLVYYLLFDLDALI